MAELLISCKITNQIFIVSFRDFRDVCKPMQFFINFKGFNLSTHNTMLFLKDCNKKLILKFHNKLHYFYYRLSSLLVKSFFMVQPDNIQNLDFCDEPVYLCFNKI